MLDLRLTRERGFVIALLAFLAVLPAFAVAIGEPFLIRLTTRILIFALAAVALDLILGFGGMVSFGHAAFVGVGAYVVGILAHHQMMGTTILGFSGTTNGFLLLPVATLVSAMFGLVIGAICLRTRGIAFIMITLAFAQMLYFLMISLRTYGGDDGMAMWNRSDFRPLFDIHTHTTFYYLVFGLLVGFLFLAWRLVNSRFGRVLRGAKDNERRMAALGFPVYRYRLVAFTLSGAVAGLAGALLANATYFVGPAYLAWTRSGELIIMVVLGGMGTLVGPVLGAGAFLLLEEYLPELLNHIRQGWGEYWKAVLGPILLFVVLFARNGIYSLIRGKGGGIDLAALFRSRSSTDATKGGDDDRS